MPPPPAEVGHPPCCEDDAIACDHSDGTDECGHRTSCSDGVASDFDPWCLGAPESFAPFVASTYADTETYVSLVPYGANDPYQWVVGNQIFMSSGGHIIEFRVHVAGWDPDQDGDPALKE